ncbi:MAG: SGNH/GDSL hydrolase family protein [Elusimicrobia bacterium]|nr:SGNH/GDSL hydrolase family protein [Elusimicrobiota bacterium]
MRLLLRLILLAALWAVTDARSGEAPAPLQVLFLGNSYTSVNDLPGTLTAVARSFGDTVAADASVKGGYRLMDHARDEQSLAKIKARPWDFVVLQEQSQMPGFDDSQIDAETVPYAVRLDGLIHAANPRAKTVFFAAWGRKSGDSENCKAIPAVCTYESQQRRITWTFDRLAARTSAVLAPVGTAWSRVRHAHPEIELYDGDGVHPSAAGTYLAACVFYSALLRKGALGASPLGLDPAVARVLQKAAQESVFAPAGRGQR